MADLRGCVQTEADGPLDSPRTKALGPRPSVDQRCCAAVSSTLCRYVDAVIAADCWAVGPDTRVIDAERALSAGLGDPGEDCSRSPVAAAARTAAAHAVATPDQASLGVWKESVALRAELLRGGRLRKSSAATTTLIFSPPQLAFIAGATRYLCRQLLGDAFRITLQRDCSTGRREGGGEGVVDRRLPAATLADFLHGILQDGDLLACCAPARQAFGRLSVQCVGSDGGGLIEKSIPFCVASFGRYQETCPLKAVPAVLWNAELGTIVGGGTKRSRQCTVSQPCVFGAIAVVKLGKDPPGRRRRLIDWAAEVQAAGACACLFVSEDNEIFVPSCPSGAPDDVEIPVAMVRYCDGDYIVPSPAANDEKGEVLVSLELNEYGLLQFDRFEPVTSVDSTARRRTMDHEPRTLCSPRVRNSATRVKSSVSFRSDTVTSSRRDNSKRPRLSSGLSIPQAVI